MKRARAQRRLRQRAHVVQDGVVGVHVGAPAGVVEPSRALAQVAAMPARVGAVYNVDFTAGEGKGKERRGVRSRERETGEIGSARTL